MAFPYCTSVPASNTSRLPSGKRSWQCPADAVLPLVPHRELSQHNPALFSAQDSSWRCCKFQARQRDRQQAFRGQHLQGMWCYARTFPKAISVEDAEEMLLKSIQESRHRGAWTLKHSRLAAAERQVAAWRVYKIVHNVVKNIVYNTTWHAILHCTNTHLHNTCSAPARHSL